MKKIALVVDGSSTLTEDEIKKNNITRITFKITENDTKSYNDLPEEISYEKIDEHHKSNNLLKTSCSALGEVMSVIDKLLLTNDFVLIFTINKTLSSQYDSIKSLEKEDEYKGKIHVVDTRAQCYGLEYILLESKKMVDSGKSVEEVIKFAEEESDYIHTSFVSESSKPATASGRMSKLIIGKILDKAKLVPILNMNDKISLNTIAKKYNKALEKMVEKMLDSINESGGKVKFISVFSSMFSEDKREFLLEEIVKQFKINKKEIIMRKVPLIIFCNTGKNSFGFAVGIDKKFKND
ncbi:MAG: DegV family protein [Mycoplasmoidaceae bacterium]